MATGLLPATEELDEEHAAFRLSAPRGPGSVGSAPAHPKGLFWVWLLPLTEVLRSWVRPGVRMPVPSASAASVDLALARLTPPVRLFPAIDRLRAVPVALPPKTSGVLAPAGPDIRALATAAVPKTIPSRANLDLMLAPLSLPSNGGRPNTPLRPGR